MKIIEEDISVLDNIIDIVIEMGSINIRQLPSLSNEDSDDQIEEKERSYEYYFKILKETEIVNMVYADNRSTRIQKLDKVTERFKRDGGFKKIFEVQRKKENLEILNIEKKINEAHLIKWHKKTYWLTFFLAILGFVIAVISLIISIGN